MINNKFEEFITNDGGSLFYIESNNGSVRRIYVGVLLCLSFIIILLNI
jgi:hypothetical protein